MLSVDGPVKQRLDTLAGELAKAADKELQVRLLSLGLGSRMRARAVRQLCLSCSGGRGLDGVSVPRVVSNVLLGGREAQPAFLLHLGASVHPSRQHP